MRRQPWPLPNAALQTNHSWANQREKTKLRASEPSKKICLQKSISMVPAMHGFGGLMGLLGFGGLMGYFC